MDVAGADVGAAPERPLQLAGAQSMARICHVQIVTDVPGPADPMRGRMDRHLHRSTILHGLLRWLPAVSLPYSACCSLTFDALDYNQEPNTRESPFKYP